MPMSGKERDKSRPRPGFAELQHREHFKSTKLTFAIPEFIRARGVHE